MSMQQAVTQICFLKSRVFCAFYELLSSHLREIRSVILVTSVPAVNAAWRSGDEPLTPPADLLQNHISIQRPAFVPSINLLRYIYRVRLETPVFIHYPVIL